MSDKYDFDKWNNFGKGKPTYSPDGQNLQQPPSKKSNTGAIIGIIIVIVAFIILLVSCQNMMSGNCGGSSNHNSVSTATCPTCGRTFEVGDSGGNFRNIALTGMCKNCYNNYKWAQEALGK